ncbi:MAG: methylenetetrahydrofolate reductase, partial [Spirochaetales bacterium]|nr:methylenetetrahydrofolate reductase [Spirochaetales bacterium]
KLSSGKKPIAVELDPPENASLDKFMQGAQKLKDAGVDILTIADCPIARARMDSSILACKVKRELDMDVLPHMTCRDRNLNATKALLLGLYAEHVRNVLLVTGDPIPTAERDEVKSVYQFNSRKLSAFVTELGKQSLPSSFHIFGALNINAHNFDVQLKLAKDKIKNGMAGLLTQPVLSENAIKNLKRAKEELDAYILGGLIPIVSERNARFMHSEVNGIFVDSSIIKAYQGLDRQQSEDLAIKITCDFAEQIKDFVDGYYIITPFNRTSLVSRILSELNPK